MRRSRRCARWRSGSPGGSASARASRRRSSTSSRAGTDGDSRTSAATRSRCRCVSCTWRGTSPSSSPPRAPTRRGPSSSVERAPRTSRGSPELALRNFDELLAELDETRMWEQALESEPFPQLWIAGERIDAAFAAIAALTGLKSPWLREHSTGVAELAEAAAWRMGLPADSVTLAAARRARARPRPRRRVERDLGEAGAARLRRVGARATPPALHRARVRAVAGARPDRGRWPAHTTSGSTAPATTAARAGRRSTRPPASSPPPTATRHARGAAVPAGARRAGGGGGADCARPKEGRLDPEAVDAVLAAAGHRVRAATSRAARRADRARAGGPARARARRVQPGRSPRISASRPRPSGTTSSTSTRRPASAAAPRRRSGRSSTTSFAGLRHRAFARCRPAPAAHTRLTIGVERRRREPTEEDADDPGNDDGRGLRPLRERSSRPRAPRSAGSTVPRARPSSATPTRTTASGCSSTGTRRAGRASSPTPRSRRSCRRPGTRAGPRSRSSAAATTPSAFPSEVLLAATSTLRRTSGRRQGAPGVFRDRGLIRAADPRSADRWS